MELKWYSGKYDSMKQFACYKRCGYSDDEFLKRYSATIRLEWFFSGKLVVTDAQWYDGLYFSRMCRDQVDFKHFIEFAQNGNLEIKERSPHSLSMVATNFVYSSVLNPDLSDALKIVNSELFVMKESNNDLWSRIIETPESFISYMYKWIQINYSKAIGPFAEFEDTFKILHFQNSDFKNRPEHLFSLWNNTGALPAIFIKHKEFLMFKLSECINGVFTEDYKNRFKNHFEQIESELCKENGRINRGLIVLSIRELTALAEKNGLDSGKMLDYLNTFNFFYNLGLANQHADGYLDGSDLSAKSESNLLNYYDSHRSLEDIDLPDELNNTIGTIKWEEFIEVITKSQNLINARANWISAYSDVTRESTVENQKKAVYAFHKLTNEIVNSFSNIAALVRERHCLLDVEEEFPTLYVAGSSDLNPDSLFGKKILVHCGNENQNGKLICMAPQHNRDDVVSAIISKANTMINIAEKFS